jgi:hypothetical protein
MKKLTLLAGLVLALGLASCSSDSCLTCTGAASSYNACSNDAMFEGNSDLWNTYVEISTAAAESVGESCSN